MPRVWIVVEENGLVVDPHENPDGIPVDMNASLMRQIHAAHRQYNKFQNILNKFYLEAVNHPDNVRRVR